jgi:hypothetical protein
MKNTICLLTAVLMVTVISACGGGSTKSVDTVNDTVKVNPADTFKYSDYNSVACVLAGKTVSDADFLPELVNSTAFKNHQSSFEKVWSSHSKNLANITAWSKVNVNVADTVFYPFGGPDFNYLDAFFPDCRFTLLIGLEKGGKIPFSDCLSVTNAAEILRMVNESVVCNLNNSFFQTNSMKRDLAGYIKGTLPIIMMFISRHNYDIVNINPVFLNNEGFFEYTSKDEVYSHTLQKDFNESYEVIYKSPDDTIMRKLYYFSMDVSDTVVNQKVFTLMMDNYFTGQTTFLKAASYLLHWPDFSFVRDLILSHSSQVVTGPSGMPYKHFNSDWDVNLHGQYIGPISLFGGFAQKDMIDAYAKEKPEKLGFRFDYHATHHSLIVAKKKK